MGGMAGIPLPPPRPGTNMGVCNPALAQGPPQGFAVVPPPPPRPGMPVMGGFGVPPPPGPPPSHMQAQYPPAYPPHMYGYPGMAAPVPRMMQAPMYGYPPQFPQPGYGAPPQQYQQQIQQQQQPRGPPKHHHQQQQKDRKPRPARGSTEEVDPLDPAGRGYTERFGAAPPPRKPHTHNTSHEEVVAATVEPPPALPAQPVDEVNNQNEGLGAEIVRDDTPAVPPPPPPPVAATFSAPSYAALSAEEVMRRRHMVHSDNADDSVHAAETALAGPSVPSPPSVPSFSYPTLSAEELLRRRHQLPAEDTPAVAAESSAADEFVPARPPVSYGAVLSAEELMRRRYMVQEAAAEEETSEPAPGPSFGPSFAPGPVPDSDEGGAEEELRRRYEVPSYEAEDVESDQEQDHGPAPGPVRGPPAGAHHRYQSSAQPSNTEADSEELMRQRFEIPDMQAEDVDDEEDVDDRDQENGYVSEDDVRSAGEPEPTFDDDDDDDDDVVRSDEEDADAEPLELNLRNLYPARLPASFTALPQSRVSLPLPSVLPIPKPSGSYSSAINFNDYGDDEDEEEDAQEEVVVAPKVQPYAVSAPQVPAVLPARAPENFPVSSYYPEGLEREEIQHAVVKGPKIVKTDRALTAFVPNAIKKKRLHSSAAPAATFSTFRKPAVAEQSEPVEEQDEERDIELEPASKAARHEHDYTASLHAATSALFRPSAVPAHVPSAPVASRAPIAPIAFVPATASTVSVSKAPAAAPAASAEEDAMALFFSEINQL